MGFVAWLGWGGELLPWGLCSPSPRRPVAALPGMEGLGWELAPSLEAMAPGPGEHWG